jgi:hypothetical protein
VYSPTTIGYLSIVTNFSTMAVEVSGLPPLSWMSRASFALGVDLGDGHLVGLLLHLAELRLGSRERERDADLEHLVLGVHAQREDRSEDGTGDADSVYLYHRRRSFRLMGCVSVIRRSDYFRRPGSMAQMH